MYDYEHTQPGTLIRALFGIVLLMLCCALIPAMMMEKEPMQTAWVLIIPVVFIGLLALFHSLTVRVSRTEISLAFGIGLVGKTFQLAEIESSSIAQSRWYHGWGIRGIKGGWLFNVSGYDTVELLMTSGKRYMIGTDEPQELLAAIESARSA